MSEFLDGHIVEWLNLLVRWLHITVGIAWIGASFYFNWLENSLNRTTKLRPGIAGNLWAIHGGGFYYLEKYKNAPETIPDNLHWFKWEAYMTWVSGISLLAVVYYLNAKTFLLNQNFSELMAWQGISISMISLLMGWYVYDFICKSPLRKNPVGFLLVGTSLLTAAAFFYAQIFTSRAAYIHLGALIGTIMVGNVFRNIIPAQKTLVSEAKKGKIPDPALGRAALLRSRHNNYLTLPVLFIMVSNHFPSTYGHQYPWAILMGVSLIGMGIRHYFNIRKSSCKASLIIPVAAAAIVALAMVTRPASYSKSGLDPMLAPSSIAQISTSSVLEIFALRCQSCHSEYPTDNIFTTAPLNVKFDTIVDIRSRLTSIQTRVIDFKTMPFNNKTKMTDAERAVIQTWIVQEKQVDNL